MAVDGPRSIMLIVKVNMECGSNRRDMLAVRTCAYPK